MFSISFGKYRALVLAVALFLLLQAGLFILDTIISTQISKDATYERLASRQSFQLQLIYESALHVGQGQLPPGLLEEQVALLERATASFNRTLTALADGGIAIGQRDAEIAISPVENPQAQTLLLEAKALWFPLQEDIRAVTSPAAEDINKRELALRVIEAQPNLVRLMGRVAILMNDISAQNIARLNQIKVAALALAGVNFLMILFYLVATLRKSDQALERAQKETEDILRTTQEGLFLLDPQHLIGSQHSQALERVIGRKDFAGVNFFSMMQPMVTEKTLATAREYLDLLFNKLDVKEKLITELNPLNCVQILYSQGPGNPESRFLEFDFNRVKEAGKITHLLVTVNDITQRINLERSLKETEARTRDQISMLIEIIQIEPAALQQFLRTVREGLQTMNDLLQKQESGLEARGSKVHALFRQTHRIKGDAAGLGLKNIAASFERLEDTLTGMHERHNLTGEDFLPIAVQVKTLYEQIGAIELLIAQITQARGIVTVEPIRTSQEPGIEQLPFVQRWRNFATEIATRQGNAVEVTYSGLDIGSLPTELQDAVTTLVNQFIRNSVVHGIESAEERKRLNKPAAGRLSIYLARRDDGGIDLGFRDDGRGISVEHIRQVAIAKGRLTPEAATALEPRRIIGLIFESGMSTRQTVDGDAGRGVGLDAVREIVTRMGGNIRLGTTVNEYCHFRISLASPAPSDASAGAPA